jgi:hypothetical protein
LESEDEDGGRALRIRDDDDDDDEEVVKPCSIIETASSASWSVSAGDATSMGVVVVRCVRSIVCVVSYLRVSSSSNADAARSGTAAAAAAGGGAGGEGGPRGSRELGKLLSWEGSDVD